MGPAQGPQIRPSTVVDSVHMRLLLTEQLWLCLLSLHSYRVSRFLRLSAIVPTNPRDIHDNWLKNNSTVLWYHELAIGVFSEVPFGGYLLPVDLVGGCLKILDIFTNKNRGRFQLHAKLCDETLPCLALYRIGQEPLFCLMFTWSPTQC